MADSRMRGAEVETIRDNPPVRSKFDKSHGKGLPAPHLSSPGAVMPTTNPAARVFAEPKSVGSTGSIRTEHIPPSQLGTGMADGRHYARAPNMSQTQVQGKSSSVSSSGSAPGNPETAYGRDAVRSDRQRDTAASNPSMGGGNTKRSAGTQVYGGERVSRGSTKQGAGVLHANKRGSGPNLK